MPQPPRVVDDGETPPRAAPEGTQPPPTRESATPLSESATPLTSESAPPTCPNCGAPVPDRFCGRCGQERRSLRVAFRHVVGETLAESLSFDSRIARTLGALVLRPGEATRAYLAGKRASQTSPVKLYLALSFLYFFIGAVAPSGGIDVRSGDAQDGGEAASASERSAPVTVPDEGLGELRGMGGIGARLAHGLEALSKLPQEEVRRKVNAGFAENAPKAMFFLVPVLALLLRAFYRRSKLYLAEHGILALHMHAVAFLFLIPGAVAGSSGARTVGMVAAGLHGTAAMHRVYGYGWPGTLARTAGVGLLYLVALGVAFAVVVLVAIMSL
ncbi:MAG TPA: DUF3667 domain-containing protein [Anaeromyxobacteraceae bacterium]|nr:DUF3667 domain-containing protein [Anaeromyxobacteraceae bacterium]